jgi:hypothetical protein
LRKKEYYKEIEEYPPYAFATLIVKEIYKKHKKYEKEYNETTKKISRV